MVPSSMVDLPSAVMVFEKLVPGVNKMEKTGGHRGYVYVYLFISMYIFTYTYVELYGICY